MTLRHHATPLRLCLVLVTWACVPKGPVGPTTQEIRANNLSTTTTSRSPGQQQVWDSSTHAPEDTGAERADR